MEREERIYQLIQARREERKAKRKILFYLRSEEAMKMKLEEEERARKQDRFEGVDCKGIKDQADDFKISEFDLRDVLVSQTVAYELQKLYRDIEFDKIYPDGQLLNNLIMAFANVRDHDRALLFLAMVQGQGLSEDRNVGGGGICIGEYGEDC
ncbi:hypothetical protein GIB67_028545 [Kingdonia uniflora]|uniref:Uncharacterized protein n=1 Tax=Kingdonia uniflora TaxID=39325 RepID=A0A7J7KW84_9MAGN|nr:hypothetical protein GIB67_028545 [Kingdonia uniflora]